MLVEDVRWDGILGISVSRSIATGLYAPPYAPVSDVCHMFLASILELVLPHRLCSN